MIAALSSWLLFGILRRFPIFDCRGGRVPGFPNTCCRDLSRVRISSRRDNGVLIDSFRVFWARDHNTGLRATLKVGDVDDEDEL